MSATYTLEPASKTAPAVLVIRIPVNSNPPPSSSGKTLTVASTHGFQTTPVTIDGKPVKVSLNASVRA